MFLTGIYLEQGIAIYQHVCLILSGGHSNLERLSKAFRENSVGHANTFAKLVKGELESAENVNLTPLPSG